LPQGDETVIIGGGIAGLACGRRLHDRQRPFRLITEAVGGRIRSSTDGAVNLGAYYVRSDYRHVNRFVDRGRRINRLGVMRGNPDGSFSRWDLALLLRFSRSRPVPSLCERVPAPLRDLQTELSADVSG
jgi:glycine/D-amino acid oxidase-like deaminating enzyme